MVYAADYWVVFSADPKFFEVKMKCKRCARCCTRTEMELLPVDIDRIVRLGYRLEDFVRVDNEYVRLKCRGEYCVFLDPETKTCRIYEHRPIGCRLYPLQWSDGEVVVDPDCPAKDTIPRSEIERLAPYVKMFVEFAKMTRLWLKLKYGIW